MNTFRRIELIHIKSFVIMNKKLIKPSVKEDAEITKAAKSDPDSQPISKKDWERIKHTVVRSPLKLSSDH